MILDWFKSGKKEHVVAEYIWIDGSGVALRSKSRTLDAREINSIYEIPNWTYDGSSTD
jgi:glutamine synthetase